MLANLCWKHLYESPDRVPEVSDFPIRYSRISYPPKSSVLTKLFKVTCVSYEFCKFNVDICSSCKYLYWIRAGSTAWAIDEKRPINCIKNFKSVVWEFCSANQLSGFYMMVTLVVKVLIWESSSIMIRALILATCCFSIDNFEFPRNFKEFSMWLLA